MGDGLFSIYYYRASSFSGSMLFIPFFLLMVFLLVLWGLVIRRKGFLILVEWSILVVRVCIEFFLIFVGPISGFSMII